MPLFTEDVCKNVHSENDIPARPSPKKQDAETGRVNSVAVMPYCRAAWVSSSFNGSSVHAGDGGITLCQ